MVESSENKAALKQKNWADEDDEDDGGDVEIGGTSVAQVGKQAKGAAAGASEAADGQQTE